MTSGRRSVMGGDVWIRLGWYMAIEIERKFLVAADSWKSLAVGSCKIRDGIIVRSSGSKVRVRIDADRASIAIKGARKGIRRSEYEYEIPVTEAEEMIETLCQGRVLEKMRYSVPDDGLLWQVDAYEGALEGIVIAQIELYHEDQTITFPTWLGREVSRDPRYAQSKLLQKSIATTDLIIPNSIGIPEVLGNALPVMGG
jgi:adenylate cyclase